MDISDDVSALSMDGASAIAGMGFAKRLRKDFAKMQLGVPIQEEEDGAENDEHDHHTSSRRSQLSSKYDRKSSPGEELIEPFPKTYEEWQRKKEKKQRKKEKKSHKHKSKKSGSKSGSRASGRHKDKEREEMNNIGEKSGPPPIMEISIQSENYEAEKEPPRITSPDRRRSSRQDSSNLSGYPSIASTADDSESQSGTRRGSMTSGMISRKQSQSSHLNNSFKSSRSSYNDSHTRSSQYDDENESSCSDNSYYPGTQHGSKGLSSCDNNQRITLMMGFWKDVCLSTARNDGEGEEVGPNLLFRDLSLGSWKEEFTPVSDIDDSFFGKKSEQTLTTHKADIIDPLWVSIRDNNTAQDINDFGVYSSGGDNEDKQSGRFFLESTDPRDIDNKVLNGT